MRRTRRASPGQAPGRRLVCQGRVRDGFARLEEALAAMTSGEMNDPFAVSTTCCPHATGPGTPNVPVSGRASSRTACVLAAAAGRLRTLGAHCQLALGGVLFAEDQPDAAQPLALGHLVRGEPRVAVAILRRAIDQLDGTCCAVPRSAFSSSRPC